MQAILAAAGNQPEAGDYHRQELFRHLSPLYKQLTDYNFRQLHFQLPDNTSFLRFHRPEKFGDSLVDIRETVMAVNATHQKVSSFEEGRIFNGFRFVYPLFHQQQHVGSVEISISSAAFINELARLFGKQYHFVLARKVVEAKVFVDELDNYGSCLLSPGLVHDLEAQGAAALACSLLSGNNLSRLQMVIAEKYAKEIAAWQPLVHFGRIDEVSYVVGLIPIPSYSGEKVAYLISFEKEKVPFGVSGDFILTLSSLTLIFGSLLLFFRRLAQSSKKLEKVSATDFLTGIWNRGKGYELLQYEHDRALRYGRQYALIMLDIDRFKAVNDTYGHPIGDSILTQVVRLIKGALRRTDVLCRWGGEEFLLLLPETSLVDARHLAEKIRLLISGHQFKFVGRVTVSLGVAVFSEKTPHLEELIQRADRALYGAKGAGRNRVCSDPPPVQR